MKVLALILVAQITIYQTAIFTPNSNRQESDMTKTLNQGNHNNVNNSETVSIESKHQLIDISVPDIIENSNPVRFSIMSLVVDESMASRQLSEDDNDGNSLLPSPVVISELKAPLEQLSISAIEGGENSNILMPIEPILLEENAEGITEPVKTSPKNENVFVPTPPLIVEDTEIEIKDPAKTLPGNDSDTMLLPEPIKPIPVATNTLAGNGKDNDKKDIPEEVVDNTQLTTTKDVKEDDSKVPDNWEVTVINKPTQETTTPETTKPETTVEASDGNSDTEDADIPKEDSKPDNKDEDKDVITKDDQPTKQEADDAFNDLIRKEARKEGSLIDLINKLPNTIMIKDDTEYILDTKALIYTLDKDISNNEYIVAELSGVGEVRFAIINGRDPYITLNDTVIIESFTIANMFPISAKYLQKDTSLIFSANNLVLSTIKLTIYRKEFLKMNFNENLRLLPNYSEYVKIKLNSPVSLVPLNNKSRLQFILESSLAEQQLAPHQELEMYINEKTSVFPDPDVYEMKASGSFGYGLIKTIPAKDKHFCADHSCEYYVTLKIKNIKSCNFLPTVFDNDSVINFNANLTLIEELETTEKITYKLKVPKTDDTWIFTITPTEGNPAMYINPDTKPNGLEDYLYRSMGHGVQIIVVTAKESNEKNFTHQAFYVTYYSLDAVKASTFKFDARKQAAIFPIKIQEGISISGNVVNKEIVSYLLNLRGLTPEIVNVDVKLSVYSADVLMIVKECINDSSECVVTEDDIENAKDEDIQSHYTDCIVKKTIVVEKIQKETELNVLLKFKCAHEKIIETSTKDLTVSRSCMFAIGVVGQMKGSTMNGDYQLRIKDQDTHKTANIRSHIQASVNANDVINYKFKVSKDEKANYKFAAFKVTALNGNCNIYFSRTNTTPNANDFESIIRVTDDNVTSLETAIYYTSIGLDMLPSDSSIYVSVVGTDYCILELYADYTNSEDNLDDMIQKFDENQIVYSRIDDDDSVESSTGKIYSKLFLFEIPPYNEEMGFLNITVNSHKLGLNICVQEDVDAFDYKKGCDYFKDNEVLIISRYYRAEDAGKKLFISVRKPFNSDLSLTNFPIEFSVLVSFDKTNSQDVKILAGGQSHSKLLTSGTDITYQLNAYYMNESGLITLSTDHPSIRAIITTDPKNVDSPIAVLSNTKFAMRIKRVFTFKQNYCASNECALYVKVLNTSIHNYRFTLTYTVDDVPIALKDGSQIFIPSDMPQYLITEADANNALVFNLFSEKTSSIVYSKIVDIAEIRKNYIYDLIDEIKFDYKSELSTEIEISQSPGTLSKFTPPIVGYYYVPKTDISTHDGMIVIYDQHDKTKVRLHSKILKLEPYYQTRFSTARNDFSYFYISVDEPQGFSVVLSVVSGEADLFINPGMFNFTTNDFYWKKSATYKGDEITITKDMFADPLKIANTYTIGVHGRSAAEYSVLFMPEFSNLIKMQYQNLIYLKLEKDKYYYFDFFNKHERFTTYFYSENSDVELSILNYDEDKGEEFIDMITNEDNYYNAMLFLHGNIPVKHITSSKSDIRTHYVIRAKALTRDSKTTLAIYDEKLPIQAYSEKRFDFVQEEAEEQEFIIKLDGEYATVDIDVKLDFGEIDVSMSNNHKFDEEPFTLNRPSQKYVNFRVKSEDIVLMSVLYIKVKSLKSSSYSILVKPADKFKELKVFKTELVYTSKDKEQYLFFNFDKETLNTTKTLVIEMYNVSYFSDKPELLFLPDADVTLSGDSPFIPMPLVDYYESDLGEFKHYQIVPELIQGFYIIKINKNSVKVPIKISVNINDTKQIEPNGIYKHRLLPDRTNVNTYEMFVPEAGEFRLLLQTCSDAIIDSALVRTDTNIDRIDFNDDYNEVYSFVMLDKRNSNEWERSQKEITYPIKRGTINTAGLLQFNVTSDGHRLYDKSEGKLDYFLISEFRPATRSLILKDYIDVYTDKEAFESFNVVYKFTDRDTRLSLKATLPKIKDQILQDFPKINKVQYRIYYHMIADNPKFFEKLSRCGFAAIETVKSRDHMQEKTIKIKDAIKGEVPVNMYFFKNDLETFVNEDNISIFVQLEIYFYENEEEEYGISLDIKMAQVPYFLLTIPNFYKGFEISRYVLLTGFLFIGAVVIFLLCMLNRLYKKGAIERDYEQGNSISRIQDNSSNKLNVSDNYGI